MVDIILSKNQKKADKDNSTSDYIKNEINKVWQELQKTSTKEELDKLRNDMKKVRIEFKNNLKKYTTKKILDNNIQKSVQELIEFIQIINEQTKKELREDIVQFKDDILTEIIKLREDIAVVVGYRDQIENHEIRIQRLEKKPSNN